MFIFVDLYVENMYCFIGLVTVISVWTFDRQWGIHFSLTCILLFCPLVSVVALTIAQPREGPLTEGTARDTDDWITAESETATGSHKEQLKRTTHATSPQACTTTGVAVRGSGRSRTGGRAAGVSTNEGGVEPGPIAHPPRWVQPDLSLCSNPPAPLVSFHISLVSLSPSFRSCCLSPFSNLFFNSQLLELVSSKIFCFVFFSRNFIFFWFCFFCCLNRPYIKYFTLVEHSHLSVDILKGLNEGLTTSKGTPMLYLGHIVSHHSFTSILETLS